MELGTDGFFKYMQTQDEVQNWFASMDQEIDAFMNAVPKELRDQLDYTLLSIDHLEGWLLEQYTRLYDAHNPQGLVVLAGAGRYVGEIIRKITGIEWHVELDKQDYVYLGLPVLRKTGKDSFGQLVGTASLSPFSLVTASFSRRRGTYIRTSATNFIDALPPGE